MPRFAILEHDYPVLHWDFLLESGEVLRSWRLASPLENDILVPAEPSFDHRRLYLDYEGPVSGGRGEVKRWDQGNYRTVREEPGRLLLCLEGGRLAGLLELVKDAAGDFWSMRLSPPPSDSTGPTA